MQSSHIAQGRFIQRHLCKILGCPYTEEEMPAEDEQPDDKISNQTFIPLVEGSVKRLPIQVVAATSWDDETQTPENVLDDTTSFWSSSGSTTQNRKESILFRLPTPLCFVTSVRIQFARVLQVPGQPIFPSKYVQIQLLASPQDVIYSTGYEKCKMHDGPQLFCLPALAPPAAYLRLEFMYFMNRQLDPPAFFVAVQSVSVKGYDVYPGTAERCEELMAGHGIVIQMPQSYMYMCQTVRTELFQLEQFIARANQRQNFIQTRTGLKGQHIANKYYEREFSSQTHDSGPRRHSP